MTFQKFMSTIAALEGPARVNRFVVTITPPPVLSKNTSMKDISLLCQAAVLPGIQLMTDDQLFTYGTGVAQRMAWGAVFTELNLSFLGDNKGLVHSLFVQWLNNIVFFNTDSQVTKPQQNGNMPFHVRYKSEYASQLVIKAYNEKAQEIISYNVFNVFPVAVAEIPGQWGPEGEYMRVNIRFAFDRWTVGYKKIDAAPSILSAIPQESTSILQSQAINSSTQQPYSAPYTQPGDGFSDDYRHALSRISDPVLFN